MINEILSTWQESQSTMETTVTTYKCKYCSKEYRRESTLLAHMCEPKRRHQQEKEVATIARIAEQNGNIIDRVFRGMNALEPRHIRRSRLDAESEEFLKKRRESRGESRRGGRKSNRRKKTMHKKRKPAKNRNTKRMKSV